VNASDWERLQRLYHEALDLPTDARAGFVAETCGADTTLQRHLASLLDAATGDDEFLRAPVRRAQREATHEPGELIGPYRIVRELGAGGMGVAFLAERDDEQFRKQVALKVMRFGIADPHLRARFKAERQILATLEHPNIARLLDGGETAYGAPYIVMEYVAGERVTAGAPAEGLRRRAICPRGPDRPPGHQALESPGHRGG
jgi:eukaryotic-like serine/threonine-protein kinase